jgi:enoyl-CoA hydratase/carnithine racemase
VAVTQETRGRILVVRIEREHKRNAIDVDTALGINAALNRLDDDPALWVGVLTGTQTVFSAGTDLKDGAGARTERGGEYGLIRRRRVKPLIAAVEGVTFGGGFEIALACDLVVASTTARFALPETRRGVVASSGALFRAVRALPLHVAKELLITGAELDAERGYHLGLVNRVTEPGQALPGAIALADQICASSPVSVRGTPR